MMLVMSINKFERFFRVAAGLDVDKKDLKRYSDFVNQKTYDLLIGGKAVATWNGRDIIEPSDLKSILEYIAALPPLNLTYSYETEERLPRVVGG